MTESSICNADTMHIHSICHVYTRYVWYIALKVNYAFLWLHHYIVLNHVIGMQH
jgi:hypothetical protein